MKQDSRLMRGGNPFLFRNCETGEGIPAVVALIEKEFLFHMRPRAKSGFLRIGFEHRGSPTILANIDRRAPYMVQRARYCDQKTPDLACVLLINTTGCLAEGDRLELDVIVGSRAQAHVAMQSATKSHTKDANHAAEGQRLRFFCSRGWP